MSLRPRDSASFLVSCQTDRVNIQVGRYCYACESGLKVYPFNGSCKLVLGNFVSIGPEVTFVLGGEHYIEQVTTYPFYEKFESKEYRSCSYAKGNIEIGSDVWIGGFVTILSGVTIGHGAVIGAGAVITKDVAPYSMVVGNPQRELRKRFSVEQIEKLLALQWWEWSDEKIAENLPWLMSRYVE